MTRPPRVEPRETRDWREPSTATLASHDEPALSDAEEFQLEKAEDAYRERNAKYITEVLGPRARPCWDTLPGEGTIVFRYTFLITDGVAAPTLLDDEGLPVRIERTTLPDDVAAQALACMLQAVEGTSFEQQSPYGDPAMYMFQTWGVANPG